MEGEPAPLARSDGGPGTMTADYEALRSAVLQHGVGGPRLGRAVIERAGMVAWMEAWSAAPPAPTSTAADSVLVRSAAGTEAVQILVGMALAVMGGNDGPR